MLHFLTEQLRHRGGRAVTLGVGILVAAVSFVLLTSSSQSSRVQVQGSVNQNFRAAYDLLVRPLGSQSTLERQQALIRNNFESGVVGGISERQLKQIRAIPGVDVAAPVAYLGWVSLGIDVSLPVGRYMSPDRLYRSTLRYSANGLSTYPLGASGYLYYASRAGGCTGFLIYPPPQNRPFEGPLPFLACFSPGQEANQLDDPSKIEAGATLYFPMLVAGIDPQQENRLVGLDRAVASGRALRNGEGYRETQYGPVVPVLGSTRSYVDEVVTVALEQVVLPSGESWAGLLRDPSPPADPTRGPNRPYERVTPLPAAVVHEQTFNAQQVYEKLLAILLRPPSPGIDRAGITMYWTASSVDYRRGSTGQLEPNTVANDPVKTWRNHGPDPRTPFSRVSPDNADVQFRRLAQALFTDRTWNTALELQMVGQFDPQRARQSEQLNRVPLETYRPPVVAPGDSASARVLGNRPLAPNANIGGYVAQPPYLLTTLEGARAFTDPRFFRTSEGKPLSNASTPISVIRIKVAGVVGSDPNSQARIESVAKLITDRTGLLVDITAGSSPEPQSVRLPAGNFGQPALTLREAWTKKGVAIVILQAIDRKSVALFALILLVTVAFLVHASLAAVRSRQQEIGSLLCIGWTRRHVFAVILGEIAATGLASGIVGCLLAGGLALLLNLQLPLERVLFVPPLAMLLTTLAGLPAAALAARGTPVDAVNPRLGHRRGRGRRLSRLSLAADNLISRPGRTLLSVGALSLAVGALTLLAAVTVVFRGAVTGTLLGDYVTVEVRRADYIATALTLVLVAAFIGDLLMLSVREHAAELITLKATGWGPRHLAELALAEAAGVALVGSTGGAVLGVVAGIVIGGPPAAVIAAGLGAIGVGLLVTLAAATVPIVVATKLPIASLADEL